MDIDGTAFKKTLVLEALKKNPKYALKLLLKHPTFYIYGALYKLTGSDAVRRKLFEKMKHIPVEDFDVSKIDPEYLRILRLAEMKGHKVVFITTNPQHIAKKWAERIRNMFPKLDMEVKIAPTMEEKLKEVERAAQEYGYDYVHFFDDSLPGTGWRYTRWQAEFDKVRLLNEYDDALKLGDAERERFYNTVRKLWDGHIEKNRINGKREV